MHQPVLFKYRIFLLLVVVVLSACKRASDPGVEANDTQLIISFTGAGVPISTTDSMTAMLINGKDTIRKKAIRGGTFFSVPLTGLKSVTYTTVLKVYTVADTLGEQHMYRLQTNVDASAGSKILGPTGNMYDAWLANYFYYNAAYNVSFAMAASPADPYYELTLPASLPYKNVYIDRTIYKTNNKVQYVVRFASSIFKVTDYKGLHANVTTFASFATQAAALSYDAGDFSLQLYNDVNNDYKVLVTHTSKF